MIDNKRSLDYEKISYKRMERKLMKQQNETTVGTKS
ncbi:hypothetical protein J2Z43_002489 [Clostridioides mangenotii]|uniref:Uncharacterized protein n=1 Tax=Metaclostridioides mangenotii TaxID=1540 RepID=A0ABS4EDR3_9FIRM|nr:hypothetical protein [Clostridioides mangenotii]